MTSVAVFDIEDLPAGLYRLTETVAPTNYVIIENRIYFRIRVEYDATDKASKRTVILTDENGDTPPSNTHAELTGPDESGVYTIVVTNTPGEPLPMTGGIGTTIFYVFGSILVLGCGVVLVVRRRMRAYR